jgi:hypothetical protein
MVGLAEAASAPRQTAASDAPSPAAAATAATSATSATAAAATSATAAAATASTATAAGYLNALGRCRVLLVEDIKRRQTDVSDFFFTQRDLMTR